MKKNSKYGTKLLINIPVTKQCTDKICHIELTACSERCCLKTQSKFFIPCFAHLSELVPKLQ